MIETMMPAEVVSAERFSDDMTDPLFPEEEAAISRAVGSRRREFATGRACARSALAGLGLAPVPILRGSRGSAVWPDGVTGSITHCTGYRAAAVAWSSQIAAVGIDAEPNEALPIEVLPLVSSELERERIAMLPGETICWDRLLFSAKESVYKAWFPLMGRYLDFSQADVVLNSASRSATNGTFAARLLVPGPLVGGTIRQVFTGEWVIADGLLLTAVVVQPADDNADTDGPARTITRSPAPVT